jgi:hypothetical protein
MWTFYGFVKRIADTGRHCRTFAVFSAALLCISVQLATGVTDKS